MPYRRITAFFSSRRVLARLLSTLLCTIVVVIRPFSKNGGAAAFLALTLKELVFSVQDNLAQQLEATILHLAGGLAGLGLSLLGRLLASYAGVTTGSARFILALFLTMISFFAGWLKSRLPRLTLANRIACFISIWVLTIDIPQAEPLSSHATRFIWIIVTPAVATLVSSLLLLQWSSSQFASDVAATFGELHSCLVNNLSNTFFDDYKQFPTTWKDYGVQEDLVNRSIALNTVYRQSAFELRIGRIDIKTIKPLIASVEQLRRELSWGMSIPRPKYEGTALEAEAIRAFHNPAFQLGHAILDSMRIVQKIVLSCFVHTLFPQTLQSEKAALDTTKQRLTAALTAVRLELKRFCDDLDADQPSPTLPRNIFDLCLFMISLLQMARELLYVLDICTDVIQASESSRLRLWFPRLTLAWLGATPSTIVLEERGIFLEDVPQIGTRMTQEEELQAVVERGYSTLRCEETPPMDLDGRLFSPIWFLSLFVYLWNHSRIMRMRLALSRFLKDVQGSSHLHHALKNAFGVGLLSIPAFLPLDSSAQLWFTTYYGQWMLVAYVWVLEVNTGATWRNAYLRLSGTIIGAAYGCVASYICRKNPYALVAAIVIAEVPISWIVVTTTFPLLGVVTSVTILPILFTPFFQVAAVLPPWTLALLRSGMIAIGLISALLVNSTLFPRHCRVMFLNSTCSTIGLMGQLHINLSRDLFQPYQTSSAMDRRRVLKLELHISKALHRMSNLLKTMSDEISLVPKPMQRYQEVLTVLHKLLDTLTALRKIRENISKKEMVEEVSTVCISMFAAEQAFRGRRPLPQFLPSLHGALQTLKRDIEEKVQSVRVEEVGPLGLSRIYALAEIDVLNDLVDTLEHLLGIGRQLFGTLSWLESSLELTITMSLHEDSSGRRAV
ncbi:hypothetical protein AX16_004186 [Volvariella volvacea WC 439]|nr:hypothetical protein AX16_004186 [Volvariella volvacea WC 439]